MCLTLQPNSVIMINAPYHSMKIEKIPNKSWEKKSNTQKWLTKNNVSWNKDRINRTFAKGF